MGALVSGTRWVALETVISRIAQLLSLLYLARILGPEAMGTIALILVAKEIFTLISQMGITQSIIHHKEPTKKQLATLYSINWILALFVYILVYFAAPFIAVFFEKENLAELLPVASLAVLIAAGGQQTLAILQKRMLFKVTAFIGIASAVTYAITAITMVTLGWGVWSLVIGQLTGLSVRSLLALWYAVRKDLFSGFGASCEEVKPLLSFGLYQTGAMTMNMINSRADQLIIGKMMGASALGLYSIGSQITLQAMQQINSIATRVAFPAVSQNQDDLIEVKRIYLAMVGNVLLVSAPIFIGLAALSPLFVKVVLGDDWLNLSPVLSILCGYVLVRSLGNMNGPLILGLGKAKREFYWNLGLLFLVPGVVYLGSLSRKIEVVAMVLLVTQVSLVVLAYFFKLRPLIGHCALEYLITLVRPLSAAAAMGVILFIIYTELVMENNFKNLIVLVLVGGVLYFTVSIAVNRDNAVKFIKNSFTKAT